MNNSVETELDTGFVFSRNITVSNSFSFKRISILTLNKIAIIGINMGVVCTNGADTDDCSVPTTTPDTTSTITTQG